MNTINTILDLINEVPEGIHTYYNKAKMRFEYHYSDTTRDDNLILTPCIYECRGAIWNEFYSLLTAEEYDLAKSYPFRRGYCEYLKEIGLYETLQEAETIAKSKVMDKWLRNNNIVVNANNLYIDCSCL